MSPHLPAFLDVVEAVREQTSRLLGSTIGYSDEDWAAPTALTGWTRSHVAAHLAEGASAMVRVIRGMHSQIPRSLYDSESAKRLGIELGSLASGLELQIRLDTSASALQNEFSLLEDDRREVALSPGHPVRADTIPLARLSEVVLHHVDLGGCLEPGDLSDETEAALLQFHIERIGRHGDYPPLHLVSDTGFEGSVGLPGEATEMHGPASDLLLWLTRGHESPRLYRAT